MKNIILLYKGEETSFRKGDRVSYDRRKHRLQFFRRVKKGIWKLMKVKGGEKYFAVSKEKAAKHSRRHIITFYTERNTKKIRENKDSDAIRWYELSSSKK